MTVGLAKRTSLCIYFNYKMCSVFLTETGYSKGDFNIRLIAYKKGMHLSSQTNGQHGEID